jgi:hypothetical protein
MQEAFEEFVKTLFTEERWPWWSAVVVFTIIGQFTSTKLFTRERAYRDWGSKLKHRFWYWMRETLMLHPIAAGFTLGYFWRDPEGQGWSLIASQMYFATAGGLALIAWALLKGYLKRKGVKLVLPGESTAPPPPAASAPGRHPQNR